MDRPPPRHSRPPLPARSISSLRNFIASSPTPFLPSSTSSPATPSHLDRRRGRSRSERCPPLPGRQSRNRPFYIEGAFPGDTLVVKLTKVRLNRDSAQSGDQTAGSALNTGYIQDTKYKDNFDSNWIIDSDKGVARLKNPSEHLKNYTVKLQPMMGCIAVAPPAHQAFRTGFLGSYGGNMDYNQMREGTTLYLPVYAPGALLFIGDGHAAQGDGELTGDALETSMQVEFTVNLIKGEAMGGPRAENDEYLMSLGSAIRSKTRCAWPPRG